MGKLSREYDMVEQHIDVAERIRKLEVMTSSLTMVPRKWKPDKDELDIITQHTLLMSWLDTTGFVRTSEDNAASPSFAASSSAHYLREFEMTMGAYPTALGYELMRFRQGVGAYPKQDAFGKSWGDQWQLLAPTWMTSDYEDIKMAPFSKLVMMSPPIGDYQFYPVDTYLEETDADPGHDSIPGVPGGSVWPTFVEDDVTDAVPAGGYVSTDGLNPVFYYMGARNSQYWIVGTDPPEYIGCEDPSLYETYNPFIAGRPMKWFKQYDFDCPNAPGGLAANDFGGILSYLYLEGADFYFRYAPVPWTGQVDNVNNQMPNMTLPTAPSFEDMRQRVVNAYESGLFPTVFWWYSTLLPYNEPDTSRRWVTLRLIHPWTGRVQAKVVNGRIVMRGKAQHHTTPSTGPIVVFPPEVAPRDSGLSLRGYVLAGLGDEFTTQYPCALELGQLNDETYLGMSFALKDEMDGEELPKTIHFDGTGFAVDPYRY